MSAFATPLLAISVATQAYGQIQQGRIASSAAQYNARVAEMEAEAVRKSAAFEAQTLTQQSAIEKRQIEREKSRTISAQRARYAKAGVLVGQDTPLDVMADTAAEFELDLAANRYNLETGLERLRYERETGIRRSKSEAAYQGLLSKQYRSAGYIGASGTLLSGAYEYARNN